MRRGAKPGKAKVKARLPVARKSAKNEALRVDVLEKRLAEALEQQTATAEILRVISNSPTDLQPVFDTIVETVVQLCGGVSAFVYRFDGDLIHLSAHHHTATSRAREVFERHYPTPPSRVSMIAQAILDRTVVHVRDFENDPDVSPASREMARAADHRSTLAVPMLRHGRPIGAIAVGRRGPHGEPRPFSDAEIALLKTFADQAVIAIENVRLFNELQQKNGALTQAHAQVSEALEQQTATSDILRVISSSPTDVQPTFDAIAASATQLCGAVNGLVVQFDGRLMHLVAHHNLSPERLEALGRTYPRPPSRGSVSGRAILARSVVQVPDVLQDPEYTLPIATTTGYRTALAVPMLRDGVPIGTILVARDRVAPFSDKQIALLQTFADQAVIAIENVRLFNETKEALEQQTATSEILRVISSSPTDIQPVLEAVAASAARVCGATDAVILRVEGQETRRVAHSGAIPLILPEMRRITPGSPAGRAILECRSIHVHDAFDADFAREYPETAAVVRDSGWRTILVVPLVREGVAIGVISIRRTEVRPFTDKEIALLQTFADQAVIAIENVRLFNETKEALEQQTATSDILRVISTSPTDLQPVFQAIIESAVRLCVAQLGAMYHLDGQMIRFGAHHGFSPSALELIGNIFPAPARPDTLVGRTVLEKCVVHVPDYGLDRNIPEQSRRLAEAIGNRSILLVPMILSGNPIGAIAVGRTAPGAFADKQIALLQTFADQAVIAVENVRLFTELQASNRELTTALDTQTATSDILRVISQSQTNVQPVFDAIVASAVRLLGAYTGALTRIAGDQVTIGALTGHDAASDAAVRAGFPQSLQSEVPHAQAIRDRVPLNIADYQTDPRLPEALRASAAIRGYRSLVVVPMLLHDAAIGAIGVTRRDPGGFTDDEIALLKTFADQAVIAIENVRLFTELEGRNRDLTATSEILRVISSSPTNVQPVFDTIVRSAEQLCETVDAAIFRVEEGGLRIAAHHGVIPPVAPVGTLISGGRDSVNGRVVLEGRAVHVPDLQVAAEEFPAGSAHARRLGWRTTLAVPLMRENTVIGTIAVRRTEARPFSDAQIELLKAFADQAVIAIENVRLFTELQASNRELTTALDTQTATSDILRVISRSQTDVQPVFDAILGSAARLLKSYSTGLTQVAGDRLELAAFTNTDASGDTFMRAHFPVSLDSDDIHCQAVRDGAPVVVADAETDPRLSEASRAYGRARGWRSGVVVPMLRHGEAIGSIGVSRQDVGGFTGDEIGLLQTFADQAVIAIENARLLSELQARTAELTRSVDELTALGEVSRALSSTLDLETVLQTIVTRAVQIAGTAGCTIWEYDEAREEFRLRVSHYADAGDAAVLEALGRVTTMRKGQGVTTQVVERRQPVQIRDIAAEGAYESPIRRPLVEAGHRALLGVPLLSEDEVIGVLAVTRKTPGEFEPEIVRLLTTFATQSALAIQNARLFREIEDKSRQLEAASRHKSEFLANMSHELRTPLNAIIGFSEVLTERMFGELNEKQDEYLRDIYASGQHLLSLINDILDLSKIEAGRMELEVTDFDLPSAIDNALILVRERASRRGITLGRDVDERLGQIRGDERKVKQVLLNLLSNALKFTPEGGRIDVSAVEHDGVAEIAVTDTGVGIAPEDQEAIFEEFRQVGTADKKVEGTGLGLALSRKFIELHGGRIWVKSQVGQGSTFTFTLPVRRED
jgi:GAF domain-containing protein